MNALTARQAFESQGVVVTVINRLPLGYLLQNLTFQFPTFKALPLPEWASLVALMTYFGQNPVAWVGQENLAAVAHVSVRELRDNTRALERLGFLLTCHLRQPDGSARLVYAIGPALRDALHVLETHYRKEDNPARAKPVARPRTETHPPACHAATPPACHAGELNQVKIEPSSSETRAPRPLETPSAPEEQKPIVSVLHQTLAKDVLGYYFTRKRPNAPPPSWWDRSVLDLVSLRIAQQSGTDEERVTEQKAAIDAAFAVSKDRLPTVRFIWENQDHFLEHIRAGVALSRKSAKIASAPKTPATLQPQSPSDTQEALERDAEALLKGAETQTGIVREMTLLGLAPMMVRIARADLREAFERLRQEARG